MILVDWEIKDAVNHNFISIEPFKEELIQPNSYDIRLGNSFVEYMPSPYVIDVARSETITGDVKSYRSPFIDIAPHQFILAETFETVTLPDDIVASIEGKSSIARLGITLHQTGGWIDAGFKGTITLEMYNSNCRPVRLYAGMTIGQLVFYHTKKCEIPYNIKKDAKYQNQIGATLSKYKL